MEELLVYIGTSLFVILIALIMLGVADFDFSSINTKQKVLKHILIHVFWPVSYPIVGLIEFYKWWSKLEDQ